MRPELLLLGILAVAVAGAVAVYMANESAHQVEMAQARELNGPFSELMQFFESLGDDP